MFEVKQASRRGISPLIVQYSESGCGKTFSGLLLARGLAGEKGKIVVADSESGRASLYADVIPGGFETFDLAAPFSPARYIEAIDTIEASGAAVGVLDSGSHEWEGIGGVLDMAADVEQRSGKPGLHCWKVPKFEHAKFVQRLLRMKIPLIICLRAKYKSRQVKENGKTVILKDDKTSPIQADDFIFEATCHYEILQNHSIILTKSSHPSLRECFPKDKTVPITSQNGEMLARWCNQTLGPNAGAPHSHSATITAPTSKDSDDKQNASQGVLGAKTASKSVRELELELWAVLKPIRTARPKGYKADPQTAWNECNTWLWREEILDPAKEPPERLPELTAEQLLVVIEKSKEKIKS